ncbi:cytochrome P450 [Bacillus salitolerans]|uniref:Cytochrome P450 n=1 Tax=Bacillus salitolerans TaxID=1437434 RepID=A0ABW4LQX5_9BACI
MVKLASIQGPQIMNYINFRKDPLKWLYDQLKLGDIVAISKTVPKPSYVINHPESVKEILTTKDPYFIKGNSSRIFSKTLGNGLLTSEGDAHKQQRKRIQPAFHKRRISSYGTIVTDYTNDLISSWTDGEVRTISQDMMNVTLRIIVKTMFGADINREEEQITTAVNNIIDKSAQLLLWPFPFLEKWPTKSNKRYKQSIEVLDHLSHQLIELGKKYKEEHLLTMLLHTRYEDGTRLQEKEIRDQVVTFIIAGHETTANVLSWMWYLVSQHPNVEDKLLKEIDTVLKGEPPTFEHLSKLPYSIQIFQETLRLYPAAWIILREANANVSIAGYSFPKGSSFLISPYAIHRHPAYFENAEKFIPERFEKRQASSIQSYSYFPFGAGSRGCIGSQFAMMEAVLVFVVISQKFKLRLANPNDHVLPEPLLSLRIKDGLQMRLVKRE